MRDLIFPEISLEGVKGVLIDIDNTLYAYGPAHEYAIKECFNKMSVSSYSTLWSSLEEFKSIYREKRTEVTRRLYPQGACRSRLFAFQAMFEEKNVKLAYVEAFNFEQLYWQSLIGFIKPDLKALDFLKKCRDNNIKVCAVTDMQCGLQVQKLEALGVEKLVNFLTTSEEVGEEKPSRLMFLSGLKKLRLKPCEVIMIGDDQIKDIDGAEKNGIKAYKVLLK